MNIQWSLVLFTAISGAGAWLFAFIGLNEFLKKTKNVKGLMVGCVLAAILLAVGGMASMTHLSHVDHVMWVLQHPAPGIFVEALLIGIDAILAIIFFVLLKREITGTGRKVIAVLAVAMGPIFTYSCGSSYMMSSQLAWNTYALPLGYLGTAIPAGAAIWLLLNHVYKESGEAKGLASKELLIGGVISLVLALAYGIVSGSVSSSQAPLFWIAVIVLGSIVPIVCGWLTAKNTTRAFGMGVAGLAGGLVGSISYRVLMWTSSIVIMSLFGVGI